MSHTYPFKLYISYKPNLFIFILAFLANIASWVWVLWNIRPQEDTLFLHYNILFGVDYIGEWWRVLFLPITGLLIFIINFVLGWLLFHKDKFISIILNSISLLCQIFILIASSILVFLNV